ncbi:MAG TPA: PQQ-dependent sugar dehydrogenase [Flavobacterium sp.]|jgi:glucose/arabinose dehydrogenase
MNRKITLLFLLLSVAAFSQTIGISSFASGFDGTVEITHAGDPRLFVVEQEGRIRIVNSDGSVNTTNFLTLPSTVVLSGGERGLLGLAFHPDYADNGFFFVNYTRAGDGATVVARYSVSSNPNVADATSGTVLLTVAQPFSNHNGGTIKFGPDGYLYIGMGDGGSGGDPGNRAQNINENLGKMLRIDVDSGSPYSIPAGNPYVGVAGNDEIWAIGVRNPWKFSFNRLNGDMWIADVGQNNVEEINKISNPLTPGLNLGWRCYEGTVPYNTSGCAAASTMTMPVAQYTHSATGGCSITGGYFYTGTTYPAFANKYFFADYCQGRINMLDASNNITFGTNLSGLNSLTTFGEDMNGELYIASGNGTIYRIVDTNLGVNPNSKMNLALYPNPADGLVRIATDTIGFPAQLQVHDLTGKLIVSQKVSQSSDGQFQVSDMESGIYLVTLEDRSGNKFQSKLTVK